MKQNHATDLPKRQLTVDDAHTVEEFAAWLRVTPDWVRRHIKTLPGRIYESERVVRFIPSAYTEARLKKGGAR